LEHWWPVSPRSCHPGRKCKSCRRWVLRILGLGP
jgi:hypothetical protein